MSIRNSWPGPNAVTTQTDARLDLAGLIVRDQSGAPRGGIFPRHTNALVTARSDMKVDVAAFEGCSIRGNGPLFQSNDGTTQVTIATAPGSNSRLDVVYFKQNESASPYSDANDSPVLASQAGVASASPVLADTLALLPAGAEPLYSVLVPAGKTATNQSGVVITPIFRYTTVVGGVIWVRGVADLAVTSGYLAMNNYAPGQLALDISTGVTYQWNGTGWVRYGATKAVFTRASATVASSTSFAALAFATATVDNGCFSHSAGVFTCLVAGTYEFELTVVFAGNASGTRGVRFLLPSTVARSQQLNVVGSLEYTMTLCWTLTFAVGDSITVQSQQNSGSSLAELGEVVITRMS